MSYICADCVREPVLREIVQLNSDDENPCEYCENDGPTVKIGLVAEKCEEVIEFFYELSSQSTAVVLYDRTPAGMELIELLSDLVQAPEGAIEAIHESLLHRWYDRDTGEVLYGDDPWFVLRSTIETPLEKTWRDVEASLRNEGRYLNPKVADFMDKVFGPIAEDISSNGSRVIVDAGPKTFYQTLYRARVFQTERDMTTALEHPEKYLGAPPLGAGTTGRMNAAGQPAFYGATKVKTALAEVRPPVGSWAVVARFVIDRPIKLLDLKLLSNLTIQGSKSMFNPNTKLEAQRREFLRTLSSKLILPVMPEHQDHNYLVTQVVASYLATHPTESIDGIIYPSVQLGGENVNPVGENIVLFYKAAITTNAEHENPTALVELWEYEPDGPYYDFCPTIKFLEMEQPHEWQKAALPHPKPTLSIVRDEIEIHKIIAIEITSESEPVRVVKPYKHGSYSPI